MPSQKIPFHWNGVLTKESALKARRPVFSRLTLALTEAIYVYKTEKELDQGADRQVSESKRSESLERAYNSLKMILPETPSPTPEGVKTLLDDVAAKNPKAAAANPRDFVDMIRCSEPIERNEGYEFFQQPASVLLCNPLIIPA